MINIRIIKLHILGVHSISEKGSTIFVKKLPNSLTVLKINMEITMPEQLPKKSLFNSGNRGDDTPISKPENKDYNLLLENLLKNR
jgi:hypothetical protein